jgi:hypothetical protein
MMVIIFFVVLTIHVMNLLLIIHLFLLVYLLVLILLILFMLIFLIVFLMVLIVNLLTVVTSMGDVVLLHYQLILLFGLLSKGFGALGAVT